MGEGVWIQGEIEGFNNRTKHTYFNVVERSDGKKASVNVAIWEFNQKRLKRLNLRASSAYIKYTTIKEYNELPIYK